MEIIQNFENMIQKSMSGEEFGEEDFKVLNSIVKDSIKLIKNSIMLYSIYDIINTKVPNVKFPISIKTSQYYKQENQGCHNRIVHRWLS